MISIKYPKLDNKDLLNLFFISQHSYPSKSYNHTNNEINITFNDIHTTLSAYDYIKSLPQYHSLDIHVDYKGIRCDCNLCN